LFDFSPFGAVLLDLDGTVFHEDRALPGAAALVARLQRQGSTVACLSNGTTSPQRVAKRLATMGIDMPQHRIYTAASAAADYVVERFAPHPRIYNLATRSIDDLLDGRVHWVQAGDEPCDAVIVGAPANVHAHYDRQRVAVELARRGAVLVGTCDDRLYPSPRGLEIGAGALTRMLAFAAGVVPVFVGKPEAGFFHHLCVRIGAEPSRCLLIGDNLDSDVAGGKAVGMKTMLVLTGVTHAQDVAALSPDRRPDWTITDLTQLA
jgi:HAD superfamily hydrolase (TIGR01450 family)